MITIQTEALTMNSRLGRDYLKVGQIMEILPQRGGKSQKTTFIPTVKSNITAFYRPTRLKILLTTSK
ncbi:MAG: hypothetical protein LUG86_00195 [Oscillospiraceae bacterium]|nr:hypothetical protein [Oscillospiraceae bacterium]